MSLEGLKFDAFFKKIKVTIIISNFRKNLENKILDIFE